jgi:hypothetical protein
MGESRLVMLGAVDVVARHVLANLAEGAAEQWENYPEIGESDWVAVAARVQALAQPRPAPDLFAEAYAYLAGLAGEVPDVAA